MTTRPARAAPRREAWERLTTTPLVVLGILFIAAYSWWVLDPGMDPGSSALILWALAITWAVFIVDVVVRIALTPPGDRWLFARTHPIDVLSALVPLFRAFRVLALLREVPYLERRTGASFRAKVVTYALAYTIVFIYFISLATYHAERSVPGATIVTFGDAVWWACVTIATVGYGDMYPITAPGRIYAVLLMIGGIVIVGTASATVISLLNERIGSLRRRGDGETMAEVHPPGLPADLVAGEPEPEPADGASPPPARG
ncbi:hypothetical protein GE115_17940 [Agromyces sp. CFH 90414]|uniref:Potassium channel domain-containing protein n=1 Tax=Agromyces agglutinans TaxID=2662258 RepID=A0A6I2FIF7_9MICO|nr:potassium channel family protein [Agromyces agglutinans]MRG61743.1 hypothetical protein [Agromyces agglutinans]